MAEQPDPTMRALTHELKGRGYRTVSHNTVWKQLRLAASNNICSQNADGYKRGQRKQA
jgi:hypothetical protein